MKTALQTAGLVLISLVVILLGFNLFGRTTSDTELEASLDNAMEHALYVALTENNYDISDEEKLAADVIHELMASCNVTADYTITFNKIDVEHGLLDVSVTQKVDGKPIGSEVTCRKTMVLETTHLRY